MTSESIYGGLIYGVSGADAMCNQLAAASTHPRVAGRRFIACPARSLLEAVDAVHLTSGGALEMPIEIDELGRMQDGTVWSATAPSGVPLAAITAGACATTPGSWR